MIECRSIGFSTTSYYVADPIEYAVYENKSPNGPTFYSSLATSNTQVSREKNGEYYIYNASRFIGYIAQQSHYFYYPKYRLLDTEKRFELSYKADIRDFNGAQVEPNNQEAYRLAQENGYYLLSYPGSKFTLSGVSSSLTIHSYVSIRTDTEVRVETM